MALVSAEPPSDGGPRERTTKYFGEENKNNSGKTQKWTIKFQDAWKVTSHPSQTIVVTLKDQESVKLVAKYPTFKTALDWGLYTLTAEDV